MPEILPLAVAIIYALALFAFASWAEGSGNERIKRRLRPPAYALALAVYCTSWTYYGAVGSVVADGWSYLPIYLGPILVFLFAHPFLRRLINAVKSDGANSISEFIGGRFGNSRGVAALVTILALLGSIPYLALQLRSLGITYGLIAGSDSQAAAMAIAAIGLALFAMIYGTRRYEAASRSDAILFAVGFESLLKIGGLMVAGIVSIALMNAADPKVAQTGIDRLVRNFAPSNIGTDFFVITLLSMAAIMCLPRQFYVTVIEAETGDDIARARWPFIAYMLIILLVILPISAAGFALLPGNMQADSFVLQLPLAQGMDVVALIVFMGGFSAATAMVLVETIALSTMVSNDLVAPFLLKADRFTGEGDLGRVLLATRRAAIGLIMAGALGWALGVNENERLASIGLIAFAAMAQFSPMLVLAVLGGNRDALAAKAGLGTGLIVWIYTLALPQMLDPSWLASLHGSLFDPNALFGISGLSPVSHGALWSLGANLSVFSLVTMRRVQTKALPGLLRNAQLGAGTVSNIGELKNLVTRFVGPEIADEVFDQAVEGRTIERTDIRKAERIIASVVGLPSARSFIHSALYGSSLSHDEVARILDDTGQSLRFSKGLLAATLENIDPGVSVVDRELNLIAWNGRYLDLFDYPPDMVRVGAPVASLIRYNAERGECGPGEVDEHVEKRLAHMRKGLPHSFERVRPDGRILKTVGGPMPSGGYVMCFTDVTAEAQALAALEKARAELEIRVAERTSELRAANRALAQADAEKTRFLAAASHDLLQPLHAARLFSAALARDVTPLQKDLLGRLDRSIGSADALLKALLDISKLDAGGITPDAKPMNLRPLIEELVETMMPLAREKGLTLRIAPGDAWVETDIGLLRSILQNLLSNAIRYTLRGGIIIGTRRRGNYARIDVIDTGPGIPADKQSVIFREFERLSNASEGGVGLGLAIVDRTARLLGATVSIKSHLGRGSRFSIKLPMIAPHPSPMLPAIAPSSESAAHLSILVVDDDPANCDALHSYLASLGHQVKTASAVEEALGLKDRFDVALVDFNLGDGPNGLDLIEILQSREPGMQCALITAARPEDYAPRANALGVEVLRKPVEPEQIERWLCRRRES
tara:strand:- start:15001 stop:18339 length:3339 start_codon:yes stop_codon:yes gene_type:complete